MVAMKAKTALAGYMEEAKRRGQRAMRRLMPSDRTSQLVQTMALCGDLQAENRRLADRVEFHARAEGALGAQVDYLTNRITEAKQQTVDQAETIRCQLQVICQHKATIESLNARIRDLENQLRESRAKEASTRTVKAVWDAAQSMEDLNRVLGERIRRFRSAVGNAYQLDATDKN